MDKGFIESGGRKLASLYFLPEKFTRILIVCHGFRGTKENAGRIYSLAGRLGQMGLGVLAFDFSGSGDSSGKFEDMTLSTQAQDLNSVIDYAWEHFNCPIILLGRSFGGSTILAGGTHNRVEAFIFWSTPFMLEKAFRGLFGADYERMENGSSLTLSDDGGEFTIGSDFVTDLKRHDLPAYCRRIGHRPAMIIHGEQDELVEAENARNLHQNLPNSQLVMVPGADHRFIDRWALREQLTIEWIEKLLGSERE